MQNKSRVLLIIAAQIIILACNQSSSKSAQKQELSKIESVAETKSVQISNPSDPRSLFTKADAEKILGEAAQLTDTSKSAGKNVSTWHWAYTANEKDKKKGKTGVIYFLYEQYTYDSSAHRVYDYFKKANEGHGIKTLTNVGDEAYFHSDNTNFYFIMARKGNKMFRVKVNKITSTTSLDEFNSISRSIAESL